MTLADLKCSTCGGPPGERPIVMTRFASLAGPKVTVVRCRKCNTQAATGLGIGTHPKALAKARKRGSKRNGDRARGNVKVRP